MKFVCLGYFDEAAFTALPAADQQLLMNRCFDFDDELRRSGNWIGGHALEAARNAVTLRLSPEGVAVTDGPFAETREYLGGILLLEARDLNHTISLMSNHPGLQAGPFEIRPADAEMNALIAERDERFVSSKTVQCQ